MATTELLPVSALASVETSSIRVVSLSKSFRLPHQRYSTLKERALHPFATPTFEVLHALHDVSFEVARGECFGVVGRNGSGKSTLLRCVAGIYPPDSGSIAVAGRVAPFIELGVGFHPELPARENAITNAILFGLTRKQAQERLAEMLEFAELEQFADQRLKNFSTGMAGRLAFSVTVHVDADVLLFDEVFAIGDAGFDEKCLEHFERLREQGKTVVVVTHEMGLVKRFCDRALVLHRGEIAEIGEPEAVAERYEALNKGQEPERRTTPRPVPAPAVARPRHPLLGPEPRRFFALTRTLALTNFKLKYAGTVLNYLWSVARPLAMFGVLLLIFTRLGRFDNGVSHYSTYLLMSVVLWTFFLQATSTSVECLVQRASLLRRLPFPHLAIPLSAVQTALYDLGLNFVAVLAFALAFGVAPQPEWIEFPFLVAFLVLLTTAVSLLLSALYVRHRDVNQVWLVLSQAIFYLSPIFYVAGTLPEGLGRLLLLVNPVATTLTEARHAFVDSDAPTAAAAVGGAPFLLVPLAVVAAMFALGLWIFRRESPRAAENV